MKSSPLIGAAGFVESPPTGFNPAIPTRGGRHLTPATIRADLGGPRAARVVLVETVFGRLAFRTCRPSYVRPDHN